MIYLTGGSSFMSLTCSLVTLILIHLNLSQSSLVCCSFIFRLSNFLLFSRRFLHVLLEFMDFFLLLLLLCCIGLPLSFLLPLIKLFSSVFYHGSYLILSLILSFLFCSIVYLSLYVYSHYDI